MNPNTARVLLYVFAIIVVAALWHFGWTLILGHSMPYPLR